MLPGVEAGRNHPPAQPVVAASGRQAARRSAISPSTSPCIPAATGSPSCTPATARTRSSSSISRATSRRSSAASPVDQTFYGLCFAPDGKTLFASGGEFEVVHAFDFDDGLLAGHRDASHGRPAEDKFVAGGLAVDADGKTLFAAGPWGHAVAIVPLDDPDKRRTVQLDKDSYPYTCLPRAGRQTPVRQPVGQGRRRRRSTWRATRSSAAWPTESHPTEMALSPDGKTLYVACANSTRVSVLDAAHDGKALRDDRLRPVSRRPRPATRRTA